jgi:phage terminase large subunit-like protein
MATKAVRKPKKAKTVSDLSEMDAYIKGLADGSIYVAKATQLAALRHLNDIERSKSPDFPFVFSVEKAARAIRFCHLLKHAKGDLAGQPLVLHPWAQFFIASIFGWETKNTHTRRFRQAFGWVPRGNSKSTTLAAAGNYATFAEGGQADTFSLATTREQARIVWGDASTMIRTAPEMASRLGIEPMAHAIVQKSTNSTFRPLASEATNLDGLNVSFAIVDETHVVTRPVWDVIVTGAGKRANSTIVSISTAGMDSASLGREQYLYGKQILNGEVEDDLTFVLIYEAPEGASPYDERTWEAANPMYGSAVRPEIIEAAAKKAQAVSSARPAFLVKHLNIWTDSRSPWLDMYKWDACGDSTLRLSDFEGQSCWLGLDLATRSDITAKAYIFPKAQDDGSVSYTVFCDSYLPEAVIEEGRNSAYQGWQDEGWIKSTPGNITDFAFIREDILKDQQSFLVQEVCYDPWAATQLATELSAEGLNAVEVRPTTKTLSEPMKAIEAAVLSGKLRHDGNKALRWMVGNVVCKADAAGNVYPRKENDAQKIDGAVALMTAMARAMVSGNVSPYTANRGLQFLDTDEE